MQSTRKKYQRSMPGVLRWCQRAQQHINADIIKSSGINDSPYNVTEVLKGLIIGCVKQIYKLTTSPVDCCHFVALLFQ